MKSLFHPIALLVVLLLSLPGTAQAQKQGLVSMHMEPVIIEAVSLNDLADALKKHTRLEVSPDIEEATPVQFFYGIVSGKKVAGPFASDRVFARKGKLMPKRGRALTSPWEAYEDPLFGFEDPLFGFEDPLFGFEDPHAIVINHEEQYGSPEEALRGLWGDARRFVEDDQYGLMIYAVSVEGKKIRLQGAMLAPFQVIDSAGLGERRGRSGRQRP